MSGPATATTQPDGVTRVRIDSWAAGGRGLGRVDGRVWMVTGAVPGDEVEARPLHDRGRFVEGRVERIVAHSTRRRTPPCPVQAACGGCPLMTVAEADQREAKRRFVADALARIGRIRDIVVAPVIPVEPALGYRTRIELTSGRDPGGVLRWGYHRADDPVAILEIESCAVAHPALQPLLDALRSHPPQSPGMRALLRTSRAGDERILALRDAPGSLASIEALSRAASIADPGLVGVVRIHAAAGRRGGARSEVVSGRGWIADTILGTPFRIPAATFLQVHAAAAEILGRDLVAEAGDSASVVELYGGVGAIGLALARRGARVAIVDADADAIACGTDAARRAGLDAALVRSDVLRFLDRDAGGAPPALLVADPPRTGFGRGVARRLAAWGPPRIAVVSCDPATLARDAAALVDAGYALERVTPYDFFPQTAHVEAVAWLRRR